MSNNNDISLDISTIKLDRILKLLEDLTISRNKNNNEQEQEQKLYSEVVKEKTKAQDKRPFCIFYNKTECKFTAAECRRKHEMAPLCFLNSDCQNRYCVFQHF